MHTLRKHFAIETGQQRGKLGGRVGVRNAAHYCAAIAYLHMPDMLDDFHEQRVLLLHQQRTFDLPLAGNRAYCQVVGFRLEVVQLGNVVDVNDVGGRGKAHVEQGNKTLPSSQHLDFLTILVEQNKRLIEDARRAVVKTWRFHICASL